jgi:hypothetical protein
MVASLAVIGTASPASSIPLNLATSVNAFTMFAGCCDDDTIGDPVTAVVQRLGRVTYVASLMSAAAPVSQAAGRSSRSSSPHRRETRWF